MFRLGRDQPLTFRLSRCMAQPFQGAHEMRGSRGYLPYDRNQDRIGWDAGRLGG